MAFTLEDGSGVNGANAYVDVAFVDTYHTDRGNTRWDTDGVTPTTTAQKQTSIIKATDHIDTRFGRRFVGFRKTKEQSLEWPRLDDFDLDGFLFSGVDNIPRQLQKACAEYALRALVLGNLLPDPSLPFVDRATTGGSTTQSGGQATGEVKSKKIKADVVEIETAYATLSEATEEQREYRRTGTRDVPSSLIPAYPAADLLIAELLVSSGSRELIRS